MITINSSHQNFFDSTLSLKESNPMDEKMNKEEEKNTKENYLDLENNNNLLEFEENTKENTKENKYDVYSTEDSKNNTNKLLIDSGFSSLNNILSLESFDKNLNANYIFENEENFNLSASNKNSFQKITKDQILESFFTCKICKNILYSPFICKSCGESACHSCFGKSSKNDMNNKYKKYDNSKFNFCKFCKNDNVNIMPNFKVLQLKEDICKNYKNFPYLENSSLDLINKVKEYSTALMEYMALNDLSCENDKNNNNNNNNNNEGIDNIKKEEDKADNSIKNKNTYNFDNNIKGKINIFPNSNPFVKPRCFFNPNFAAFANMPMFKNLIHQKGNLHERFMDMARMKHINNLNNYNNQNFIFNNFNHPVSPSNASRSDNFSTPSVNKIQNKNIINSGNSSIYNTINLSNNNSKNNILINAKFFIVRSIYKENLDISKKLGIWATTPYNESKLRDAYKNNFVILLFTHSNNSLFYGCAIIDSFRVNEKISEKFNNDDWKNDRGIKLGNLFKINWLSDCEIPIYKLRAMNNPLNKNIPVLRSKDCQEVPYSIGSYVFKICESFSRKTCEEVDYDNINKNILNKRTKEDSE